MCIIGSQCMPGRQAGTSLSNYDMAIIIAPFVRQREKRSERGGGKLLAVQLLRPSFGSVLITEEKNEKKQQESKAQNVYVEHVSSESSRVVSISCSTFITSHLQLQAIIRKRIKFLSIFVPDLPSALFIVNVLARHGNTRYPLVKGLNENSLAFKIIYEIISMQIINYKVKINLLALK